MLVYQTPDADDEVGVFNHAVVLKGILPLKPHKITSK